MAPLFPAPAEGWGALRAHFYGAFGSIQWGMQPHISNLTPMDPPKHINETIPYTLENPKSNHFCLFSSSLTVTPPPPQVKHVNEMIP